MNNNTNKEEKTQNVLVVGASRGIGLATAKKFKENNFSVFGTYRNDPKLLIKNNIHPLRADINDENSIKIAIEKVISQGSIDILVIASGITRDNLLLRMSNENIEETITTNLVSPIKVVKAAIKSMLKQKKGSIVLVSSISGKIGVAGQTNYTASKAGLEGFSRSVAREYGSKGIRINVVAPGPTKTDMLATVPKENINEMIENVLLKRLGEPEEISDVIFWVSQSTYMTGATIPVSGGLQ